MKKIALLMLSVIGTSLFAATPEYTPLEDFDMFGIFDGTNMVIVLDRYVGNQAHVVIPPFGWTKIGSRAFWNNKTVESVIIPEGVLTIEQETFKECTNLQKVVLPKSIRRIECYAFSGCVNLTEINFGDNLYLIGESAFTRCHKLDKIVLPRNLRYLGRNAFFDCNLLERVYFKGNAPYVPSLDFPVSSPGLSLCDSTSVFGSLPHAPWVYYLKGTTGWEEAKAWVHLPNSRFGGEWILPDDEPEVFVSQRNVTDGKVEMTLVFGGALQSSPDMINWETVAEESPCRVSEPLAPDSRKFYRAVSKSPAAGTTNRITPR